MASKVTPKKVVAAKPKPKPAPVKVAKKQSPPPAKKKPQTIPAEYMPMVRAAAKQKQQAKKQTKPKKSWNPFSAVGKALKH